MNGKWIFQEIKDAQEQVLYAGGDPIENLPAYYAALRDKVEPETYVRYELYTCDIYVDVEYIKGVMQSIYGGTVSEEQVMEWVFKYMERHHVLES